jgi:hypothetical protein
MLPLVRRIFPGGIYRKTIDGEERRGGGNGPVLPLGGGLWDVVGANPADAAGDLKVAATVPTADSESNLHASF